MLIAYPFPYSRLLFGYSFHAPRILLAYIFPASFPRRAEIYPRTGPGRGRNAPCAGGRTCTNIYRDVNQISAATAGRLMTNLIGAMARTGRFDGG